ncbi:family 16 glycosylhydrolase [Deinococcus maricopensis]|uniref:Glycoside hydrolase family 16 n=1 Tax=Deinococcus maricopensis (strain DSM 21211 / LMG 22137 / NRRL B-23946 / LB-34) TaxID=709986 RepID=E8U374_DEIML|nr:family 16 glycosylhydrolase [Deinococcus maricopensis]ADV66019.1 glycoside hydrolase family 16 [Deinococcus maricopensis DSM 21211]
MPRHLHLLAVTLTTMLAACTSAPATSPVAVPEAAISANGTSDPTAPVAGSWRDDFNTLDTGRWALSTSGWTPFWAHNGLTGAWAPENVSVQDGYLVLRLDVNADLSARGAELSTLARYGYGRYEARLRSASTSANPAMTGVGSSGDVSAFFNYTNDSETEIDHEVEGQNRTTTWAGAWKTTSLHDVGAVSAGADLSQDFHTYRWDWTPTAVNFYLDGTLKRSTTVNVPQAAANLMLNLWPTNSAGWGGMATPGTKYLLVDYVSFTPSVVDGTPALTDDTAQGATTLRAGVPATGAVSASDTQDWYALRANGAGGSATVKLTTATNSDLEVYAADGRTLLGRSARGKANAESVTVRVQPNATYFVRVVWASGTPTYTVSASGAVQ